MEEQLIRRIEQLEQQVRQLNIEVAALKGQKIQPKPPAVVERPPVIEKAPPIVREKVEKQPQKTRSFEERVMHALPKVFMVIFVLGILWILKLVSDYGFLSDHVKVFGAYGVSVVLVVVAQRLERKYEGQKPLTTALYGGAFIIGILATAAGAILYNTFSMLVALMIALVYIAYGVAISYMKGKESLTIFVVFTSLLLPYLLEYMAFDARVIAFFIVILMAAVQVVIVKHHQHFALYTSGFFSALALFIIWLMQRSDLIFFALGFIIITAIFVAVWWRLYNGLEKYRVIAEGALFSFSSFLILLYNSMIFNEAHRMSYLIGLFAIFAALAYVAFKREKRVFDITATIALLLTFNMALVSDVLENYALLLYVCAAFAGIMLGIRLQAIIMKITYTVILFFIGSALIAVDVRPFWHGDHIATIVYIAGLLLAYNYAVKTSSEGRLAQWLKKYYGRELVAALITLYIVVYAMKLDFAYFSTGAELPYFVLSIIAIAALVLLTGRAKFINIGITLAIATCFAVGNVIMLMTQSYGSIDQSAQIITRVIYIVTILLLIADFYKEGAIFKRWQHSIQPYIDITWITLFVLFTLHALAFVSYIYNSAIISWGISLTAKTLILFAVAALALWIGTTKVLRKVKITGFVFLGIALFKLLFIDLASLDLLVRAVLFIVVGGVGLVLLGRVGRR